jgi:hypothetical protein
MIYQWCCEATLGSGDIGSGCYLSMLAISLKPAIPRNPEHLLVGTSLGYEYMKQDKYISEDERGGFKVAKVNLPLYKGRLRLFLRERRLVRGVTNWFSADGNPTLCTSVVVPGGLPRAIPCLSNAKNPYRKSKSR